MNTGVKKRWVEALRSGEYTQGKFKLRSSDDEYCCLGVLCDLHSKETGTPWQILNAGRMVYLRNTGVLPAEVKDWADTNDELLFNYKGQRCSLMGMNDGDVSFADIATVIEEQA